MDVVFKNPIAGKKILKNNEIIKMKWECLAGCILAQTSEEFYFCWSRGHDQNRTVNIDFLVNSKHSIWNLVQEHPFTEKVVPKGAPKKYSNELVFSTIQDVIDNKVTLKELTETYNVKHYSVVKAICLGRIRVFTKRGIPVPFTDEELVRFANITDRINKNKKS